MREYHKQDLTLAFAAENPHERFCDSRQVFPEDGNTDHPYIQWNKRRFGSTHWFIGYSSSPDGLTFGVSIHPPASKGPLSPAQEKLFRQIFDHMDKAVRLAATPSSLATTSGAQFYLGRDGRVFGMSPHAERIVSGGGTLRLVDGYLLAENAEAHAQLLRAVEVASQAQDADSGGTAIKVSCGCGPDWLIVTAPLLPDISPSYAFQPKILLRVVEQKGVFTISPRARGLFALTRREAEIAGLITAGHAIESAAAELNISSHTVRVHLKSLFRKTSTNRQSDLARLLADVG